MILNTSNMTRTPLGGSTRFSVDVSEIGGYFPTAPLILESDRTGARVSMVYERTERDQDGDVLWVDYKGDAFGVELRVFND